MSTLTHVDSQGQLRCAAHSLSSSGSFPCITAVQRPWNGHAGAVGDSSAARGDKMAWGSMRRRRGSAVATGDEGDRTGVVTMGIRRWTAHTWAREGFGGRNPLTGGACSESNGHWSVGHINTLGPLSSDGREGSWTEPASRHGLGWPMNSAHEEQSFSLFQSIFRTTQKWNYFWEKNT
jgi:hypothetical protein